MSSAVTTTSTLGARRAGAPVTRIRRLVRASGSVLAAIASRWNDFVDSGQLGPSRENRSSRPTGTWI